MKLDQGHKSYIETTALFLCMCLFLLILIGIHFIPSVRYFDLRVDCFMESIHSHRFTDLMIIVTDLGTWGTAIVTIVAAMVFAIKRNLKVSALWAGAWIGAVALDQILKLLIARPRPPLPHLVHVMNFSFPSGHALVSIVIYGLAAYNLSIITYTRAYKPFFIVLWIVLFTTIGFSRLYLEVHYFSDVIAGYAIGGAWLIGCIKWERQMIYGLQLR